MDLARMQLNAAGARRAEDHRTADYWDEQIAAIPSTSTETEPSEWDVLKGSPEHG